MTDAQRDRLWRLRKDALARMGIGESFSSNYFAYVLSEERAEYRKLERLEAAETVKRLRRTGR